MKRRRVLLVDGQVFQTAARDRGMGRYSAWLIASILRLHAYDTVRILLTKNGCVNPLPEGLARQTFPGAELVYLNLVDGDKMKLESAADHNKVTLNNYISSQSLERSEVDFLIPSPFQEPVVSVYPDGVKKVVVFYDLIPYLYHTRYQPLMRFDNYLKRFSLLFEADCILAISQAVKDDLMVYLGLPDDRIAAIDGAPIKSDSSPVLPSFDVPDHYILMPTSDDPRKNNMRSVLGFEEFRATQAVDYKLVITSKIHESEKNRLNLFSKNIIFTGNLPGAELDWLYGHCEAVLFAPESEGLGLPILEAVMAEKRVVCSNLTVFREISTDAFYFCDHESQHSIAAALERALGGTDRSVPNGKYQKILAHYNWEATAERAIEAVSAATVRTVGAKKPRIAVFAPRPDGLSAVGKVVAEGHYALNEIFDVDYYIEQGVSDVSVRPNFLQYIARCFDARTFGAELYGHYDAVIYHVGNSDYHIESITNSLYLPGYVILHDTNISEAYRIMTERDMISEERAKMELDMTKTLKLTMSNCLVSVCARQLGIITHSEYAKEAVEEIGASSDGALRMPKVTVAHLATAVPHMMKEREHNRFTIGLAGIIADIKGIEVIESIAKDPELSDVDIRLFGFNYASTETLDRLRSYPNVSIATNLTDFDFTNSMSKLDVYVNYRMRYQGETSLSTLEAMRQGVVVIVRNTGWYAELAENTVVKVDAISAVRARLKGLVADGDALAALSQRAKASVASGYSHLRYAQSILKSTDRKPRKSPEFRRASLLRRERILNYKQLRAASMESDNEPLD